MTPKDTRCVLPYLAMNVHINGGLAPCCYQNHNDVTHKFDQHVDWRGQGLRSLKQNLAQGIRDARCQRCWDLEDNGVTSYRQQWNHTYADQQIDWQDFEKSHDLRLLHLDFDSLCNLRCIMCHPSVSSSLETEYRLHAQDYEPFTGFIKLQKQPWHENDLFDKFMQTLEHVDTLVLTGGEPLMNPKISRLLQTLDLSRINLIITTNGTQLRQETYDLLAKAKTSSITVSLEGVRQHNDYLRHGSEWDTITHNIDRLCQLSNWRWTPITVNHTLQATSAWSLPPLLDWLIDRRYLFNINILSWPPYLGLSCLSDDDRMALIDQLKQKRPLIEQTFGHPQNHWVLNAIAELEKTNHDPVLSNKFRSYINMLDRIRGTDFQSVFVV